MKHTKCKIETIDKILKDNDITENSFLLNSIDGDLIKKIIDEIKNDSDTQKD